MMNSIQIAALVGGVVVVLGLGIFFTLRSKKS